MSVKLTLEFKSVDEAIVALGKLVGAPVAPLKPVVAAGETKGAEIPAPATGAPTTSPRPRKQRADKGQPREPYGPRTTTGEPAASEPGTTAANSVAATTPAAPAAPTQTAAPTQASTPAPESAAPAAAVPTDAEVQAAVEKLFNAKGFDDCLALLSRFGVKRGKDLPGDQRANFIRRVDGVIAGEAI